MDPAVSGLISSGYTEDYEVVDALSGGAQGFLKKPYTAEAVPRAVRAALDR